MTFRNTLFSADRVYRYTLWRRWTLSDQRVVQFVGLNPSTADETHDDPTIRRCIGFAKAWGYTGLVMTNLFAFRATDPKVMRAHPCPIGVDNDDVLRACNRYANLTVACWGAHGSFMRRDEFAKTMLDRLHVLKLTKDGHPGHPLYLPKDLLPSEWDIL